MDDDLKLVERLRDFRDDLPEVEGLMTDAIDTITRLHASRTADRDTIDGLVKDRDEARASLYDEQSLYIKLLGELEIVEAQRDVAREALGQISRMKRDIDPAINATTLNAAIVIASRAIGGGW